MTIIPTAHKWLLEQKEKGWQTWFAYYPVEVNPYEKVFLEYVERRITGLNHSKRISSATWEYRKINNTTE